MIFFLFTLSLRFFFCFSVPTRAHYTDPSYTRPKHTHKNHAPHPPTRSHKVLLVAGSAATIGWDPDRFDPADEPEAESGKDVESGSSPTTTATGAGAESSGVKTSAGGAASGTHTDAGGDVAPRVKTHADEGGVKTYVDEDDRGGMKTGVWLSEVADPFEIFHGEGFGCTLATPAGGPVPLDDRSMTEDALTPAARAARTPGSPLASKLATSAKIEDVQDEPFDIVFIAGGHAACHASLRTALKPILDRAWISRAVCGAVCHGVAALRGSRFLGRGVRTTGFSDAEEKQLGPEVGLAVSQALCGATVEAVLRGAGCHYSCAAAPWGEHVVVDAGRRLVTGQNPASAERAARECVALWRAGGGKGVNAPPAVVEPEK